MSLVLDSSATLAWVFGDETNDAIRRVFYQVEGMQDIHLADEDQIALSQAPEGRSRTRLEFSLSCPRGLQARKATKISPARAALLLPANPKRSTHRKQIQL